jgi:hypothetical protein
MPDIPSDAEPRDCGRICFGTPVLQLENETTKEAIPCHGLTRR